MITGGISHQDHILPGIKPPADSSDLIHRRISLFPLHRQPERQYKTAVILSLQLLLGIMQRIIQLIQVFIHFIIQRHIALLILIIQEQEHVDNRDIILINSRKNRSVLLLVISVGHIKKPDNLNIQIRQLRKIPGRNLICQHIIIIDGHIGQPQGTVHIIQLFYFLQRLLFRLIIPPGNHNHQLIGGPEGSFYLLLGDF